MGDFHITYNQTQYIRRGRGNGFFAAILMICLLLLSAKPIFSQANIKISKTASHEPAHTGDSLIYTIAVVNEGNRTAFNVVVHDTITAFADPVFRTETTGDWHDWTGSWNHGAVSPSQERFIYIRGKIALDQCADVSNTAFVTWQDAGDKNSATVITTILDTIDPVISCVGDQNQSTDIGQCYYTHTGTAWDAVATDNCGIESLVYQMTGATTSTGSSLNNAVFNQGRTTVIWTATDYNGNTAACQFDVFITDNENPSITCPTPEPFYPTDSGECFATLSFNALANDNCSIAEIRYLIAAVEIAFPYSFPAGTTIVEAVASDENHNTANCFFTVVVQDNEAPQIQSCAADQDVNLNNNCRIVVPDLRPYVVTTDNCSENLIIIQNPAAGSVIPSAHNQQHVVVITVADGSNNTSGCSVILTAKDVTPPVISCIGNHTVNTNPNLCSYTHNNNSWNATASDNCTILSLNYSLQGATTGSGTSLNGTVFQKGVTVVTWVAMDEAGNSATCSFNVTVNDNQLPTISCRPGSPFMRTTSASTCYYNVQGDEFDPIAFGDNCPEVVLTNNYNNSHTLAGENLPVGIHIITWTATDNNGNIASCPVQVVVTDNVPPVFTNCQPYLYFDCPDDIPPPDPTTLHAIDNCGLDRIVFHEDIWHGVGTLPGFCPDSITRVYRAVDIYGNTSFCTQILIPFSPCDCQVCQDNTPHFWVDLTDKCDSVWVSPSVSRQGYCCGHAGSTRCISFSVKIGPGAVGFYITATGAMPGGWFYQVDCGPQMQQNSTLCVPSGTYYTITICKPGSNQNVYSIHSVCGIIGTETIEARVGCENQISVSGVSPPTITWSNITGDYLHYLSGSPSIYTSPNGNDTVYFTADEFAPSVIKYLVCGESPTNPCSTGGIICDTVTVRVFPEVNISIAPSVPTFCHNDPRQIVASINPSGSDYSLQWFTFDNIFMGEGVIFTPPDSGWYYVTAVDPFSSLLCSYDTLSFHVQYNECLECAPEQYHCESSDIEIFETYAEFIEAGGTHDFPCSVNPATFNLAEIVSLGGSCPELFIYRYSLQDICGNRDTCDILVTLNDTIAPTFSLPSDTVYCVEDLIHALYNPNGSYPVDDLTYPRPDYYLHNTGNTILDLINLDDNCTSANDLLINWEVDFGSNGIIDVSGTGQLSAPPPIFFPVGINIIYFVVTDACGNAASASLTLIVSERPHIQDNF